MIVAAGEIANLDSTIVLVDPKGTAAQALESAEST
jgi:hypothetical protein